MASEMEGLECFRRREVLSEHLPRCMGLERDRQVKKTLRIFCCVLMPVQEISVWIYKAIEGNFDVGLVIFLMNSVPC